MAKDKAVDSAVLDGYFSDIANAIRGKNGESGTYTPAQMAGKIADITTAQVLIDLLTYQASGEVDLSGYEDLGYLVINLCAGVRNAVTKISSQDLKYFYYESSTSFVASGGGMVCQADGAALEEIDFPKCEIIALRATSNKYWQNLKTINMPELKRLIGRITSTYLTTLDLPELTTITDGSAFYGCTALTTVNMPKLQTTGNGTFNGCTALTEIELPCLASVTSTMFNGCSALSTVDIGGEGGSIAGLAFRNCTNLTTVILRSTTLKTLQNVNAFQGSGIAAGTGYIYVPRDLISTYQADTNWSTYAAQFRAIEDLPA